MLRPALLIAAAVTSQAHAFDLQGHRGARGLAPENTLPAFARALTIGVTTLELDAGVTEDGVVVVAHDRRLNPDIARGPDGRWLVGRTRTIHELTFHELSRYDVGRLRPGSDYSKRFPEQRRMDGVRIPKLEEVFELARKAHNGEVRFNIETKLSPLAPDETAAPDVFTRALIQVVRASGVERRTIIQSFDWRTLALVQREAPEIAVAYLTSDDENVRDVGREPVAVDERHPARRSRLGAEDGRGRRGGRPARVGGRADLVAELPRPDRGAGEGSEGPRARGASLDGERGGRNGTAHRLGRRRHHHRLSGSAPRRDGSEAVAAAEADAGLAVGRSAAAFLANSALRSGGESNGGRDELR